MVSDDHYGVSLAGDAYKEREPRFEIGEQLREEGGFGSRGVFYNKQGITACRLKDAFGLKDIDTK